MKEVKGKEFCKILEAHGWVLQRIKGSHHIYGREGEKTGTIKKIYVVTILGGELLLMRVKNMLPIRTDMRTGKYSMLKIKNIQFPIRNDQLFSSNSPLPARYFLRANGYLHLTNRYHLLLNRYFLLSFLYYLISPGKLLKSRRYSLLSK